MGITCCLAQIQTHVTLWLVGVSYKIHRCGYLYWAVCITSMLALHCIIIIWDLTHNNWGILLWAHSCVAHNFCRNSLRKDGSSNQYINILIHDMICCAAYACAYKHLEQFLHSRLPSLHVAVIISKNFFKVANLKINGQKSEVFIFFSQPSTLHEKYHDGHTNSQKILWG